MKLVKVSDLFDVVYGSNLELNALELDPDGVNFVSRTAQNNGVSAKVKMVSGEEPIEAGMLTVAGGGSVAETFLQPEPFYSGRDLFYLRPKVPMSVEQKLFFCMCIRANKFRFNYGRQANKTLPALLIPDITEVPDWTKGAFKGVLAKWTTRLSSLTPVVEENVHG
jgi:hypothetical protein